MAFLVFGVYILSTLALGILIYYFINRVKRISHPPVSPSTYYNTICKLLPLGKKNWKLARVENGVRVWLSCNSKNIFATSAIIPASLKEIKDILIDHSLISEWNCEVDSVSRISISNDNDSISNSDNDVIEITKSSIPSKFSLFCKLFKPESKMMSRTWNFEENVVFWLNFATIEPQSTDKLFNLFIVFPVKDREDLCCVIVATEHNSNFCPTQLTSNVTGLHDLVVQRKTEILLPKVDKEDGSVISANCDELPRDSKEIDLADPPTSDEKSLVSSEDFIDINDVYFNLDKNFHARYTAVVDAGLKQLMECYQAKAGTNGWIRFGTDTKNPEILKKPASPEFSIWDCSKGTTEINVPIHFLLAYLDDLGRTGEHDDMFERGQVVENLGELTKILHLEYRGIWPVSGRDFVCISAIRLLDDNMVVFFTKHVKHSSCPNSKKLVRGKILIGGYVMKILNDDPPRIMTTYITHVDLQGSVPSRIVNKITANQPASVLLVKKNVEEMYKEELNDPQRPPSKFKKDALIIQDKLRRANEFEQKISTAHEQSTEPEPAIVTSSPEPAVSALNGDVQHTSSVEVQQTPDESNAMSNSLSLPHSVNGVTSVVNGVLDYKTIGNETTAALLQETYEVSEVDFSKPKPPSMTGQWQYQETDRNVMMFKKVHENEKMHSFIGKGLIKCPPLKIWEVIRDPQLTHRYNNMLKETKTLQKLNDTQTIEYIYFETEKCFKKESRDFVVLKTARKEKDKYLLSYVSVDYPNAPPPKKDAKRGKIITSGWLVEPFLHDNQLFSRVTYLAQVNPGGSYPAMLINAVGRKQPLCVAYLRRLMETPSQNFDQSIESIKQ